MKYLKFDMGELCIGSYILIFKLYLIYVKMQYVLHMTILLDLKIFYM